MRVPAGAHPEVQQSLREVWAEIDLLRKQGSLNHDLTGKRTINASDALQPGDYITKRQLTNELLKLRIKAEQTAASATQDGADTVDDNGEGAAGCAAAGPDGHPAVTTLDIQTAGMIVCGTANEFPALSLVTVDQATRDANLVELVLRIIWHLNLAGYTAGRQQNPSGVISKDKVAFQVDGVFVAYDIFSASDDYTIPLITHMIQVSPAHYIAEAGTSD